jgi:hypothetical protein
MSSGAGASDEGDDERKAIPDYITQQ